MLKTLSIYEWAEDVIEGSGSYRDTVVRNLSDSYQQFQYKLSCKLHKDHLELHKNLGSTKIPFNWVSYDQKVHKFLIQLLLHSKNVFRLF